MARFDHAFFDSGARWDAPDAPINSTMRDLTRFLDNPFDDRGISVDELLAFTTDHLQRMISNNAGGELSGRITATTSALQLVEDCVTDTKLAIRKSRKQAKEAFRASLPESIGRIAGAVMNKFGQNSVEMTECLPHGRSIFSTCRDDKVENNLQTTINGLTAHQAVLGAQVVADAIALKAAWMTVYTASEDATGGKTTTQEGKKLARENLQLMLFLNLLKLAEMFPRQPDKLKLYMQQHLLENPASPPDSESSPEPAPAPQG